MTQRLAGLAGPLEQRTHTVVVAWVQWVARRAPVLAACVLATACSGTINRPGADDPGSPNAHGNAGSLAEGSGGALAVGRGGAGGVAAGTGAGAGGAAGSSAGNGGAGSGSDEPVLPFAPGQAAMRRLTREQYLASVQALLGPDIVLTTELEADSVINGSVSIGTSRSTISPHATELYETAAYELAAQAITPDRRELLSDCAPSSPTDRACTEEFVRTFGRRVFRRPLTDAEVTRYVTVAEGAATELGDFWSGIEFALAGLLQSPHFLFRSELGQPDPEDPTRLRYDDYEMASRLSFFLWNVTPDDALLDAAEAGELVTLVGLQAQAERLAADPRARAALEIFHTERLGLDELSELSKDGSLFPEATPELAEAMRQDILRTIEEVTLDGDYRDLFDTDIVFAEEALAELYGVEPSQGDAPSRLPADGARIGILGKAGLLAMHAHTRETSPTRRGKFVRERLLCQSIPAPPPNVVTTLPEPNPNAATMRERLAVHATNDVCASCHSKTDPIGLALEHFDPIGQYRETDDGHALDVSGELDGEPFADARELALLIRERPEAVECVVRQLYRYANARVEERAEEAAIDSLSQQLAAAGHRLPALLVHVATSDGFRFAGLPEDTAANQGAMP